MFFNLFQKNKIINKIFEIPKKLPPSFRNELYTKLEVNYENYFACNVNRELDIGKPLIKQIRRISFELSNLCNYTVFHKKCPTSRADCKLVLPSSIVHKVIDEIAEINFDGVIAFHRYNEPLVDSRLFDFIKYVNRKCPIAKILILTNGFYLTQELADELAELNIWNLAVSAYFMTEYNRLKILSVKIPYFLFFSILDNREDIYDDINHVNVPSVCYAPLRDLTVNVNGDVVLCCMDWKNKYVFGNLKDNSVNDIINKEPFKNVYNDLIHMRKNIDICKKCNMVR